MRSVPIRSPHMCAVKGKSFHPLAVLNPTGRSDIMDVKDAIDRRRAYRSLEPVEVTEELVHDLARAAHKSASCFNNQPWRFVFVYDPEQLERMHEALTKGNAWAKDASLMVVVLSKPDLDCRPKDRDYNMFDTGMAAAHMMLRATEMGLVAHPTAGYSPSKTREVLGIPEEYTVVTIVHVGKLAGKISDRLQDWQQDRERGPRVRRPLETVAHHDRWHPGQEPGDLDDKGSEFEWPRSDWLDTELEWPAGRWAD